MALQHKYELTCLDDMYGNDATLDKIDSLINRDWEDIPRVFLFSGREGTGKTTLAKVIAQELDCNMKMDYIEIDASSDRGIDAIRSLKEDASFVPMGGNVKCILIDEVHGVTGPAQEAMLKMLNKSSNHTFFFLCTTEPEHLKPTTLRRCHNFDLNGLTQSIMMDFLKDICDEEEADHDKKIPVLKKITEISNGSPGTALKYLDMVIDTQDNDTAIELLTNVTYDENTVKAIVKVLLGEEDQIAKWNSLRIKLKENRGNPESLRRGILNYLNAILLNSEKPARTAYAAKMMGCFYDSVYYSGYAGLNGQIYVACQFNDIPF